MRNQKCTVQLASIPRFSSVRRQDFAWLVVLVLLFTLAGCTFPPFGPEKTATPTAATPAALTPTPLVMAKSVPVIAIAPAASGPGAKVFVSGAGWQPLEVVAIKLEVQQADTILTRTVVTVTSDADGHFTSSFVYPTDPLFSQATNAHVIAQAPQSGTQTTAALSVLTSASPTVTGTTKITVNLPIAISNPTPSPTPTVTPTQIATPTPTQRPTTPGPTNVGHVTSNGLNVRQGPTLAFTVLRALQQGARLTIIGQNAAGDWLYVLLDDGTTGWVARNFTDYQRAAPVVVTPQPPPTVTATATNLPTPTPTLTPVVITDWRGEYYANATLSGAPVLVRNDLSIDFTWGDGAPTSNLPADHFSVRWTRSLYFNAGTYRFHAQMDDGLRLYVDSALVIDEWRDGGVPEVTADRYLGQGVHSLRVEYYENSGAARALVWWESVETTPTSFPDWKGEYWSNRKLDGDPTLVRNDSDIDFDWGNAAPASNLPADDFSARWTRRVTFRAGLYRFSAQADDGIRFYLDDDLLIDEWHTNNGNTVYTAEVALDGRHRLKVEYYERGGDALVEFAWQRIATATPTPTVLFTPTWTPIPTATATVPPTPTFTPTPTPTVTPLPPPTATLAPYAKLEPTVGGPNTTVTISGGGFPANTTVNAHLTSLVHASQIEPSITIYQSTQTDSNGNYAMTFAMPEKWPDNTPLAAGKFVVLVVTNDFSVQASALFDYMVPPTQTPSETLTPLPTATPTSAPPTETPTETPTVLPTDTPTPVPTETPTPLPTDTPLPPPTATATELPPTATAVPLPTDTPTESPPTATPTLAASPEAQATLSSGKGKTHVVVKGSGFPARVRVNVYLTPFGEVNQPENWQPSTTAKTDEHGRCAVAFVMPTHWPDGSPIQPGKLQVMVVSQNGDAQATAVFDYNPTVPSSNSDVNGEPQ
ncbi:MAG: PA14 domain-containing protein [Caldilineaceae bacterium]